MAPDWTEFQASCRVHVIEGYRKSVVHQRPVLERSVVLGSGGLPSASEVERGRGPLAVSDHGDDQDRGERCCLSHRIGKSSLTVPGTLCCESD